MTKKQVCYNYILLTNNLNNAKYYDLELNYHLIINSMIFLELFCGRLLCRKYNFLE